MRGILVAFLIFAWMPVIIFKPHIGVLVWSWVSHMQPHSYTYNFAQSFPFLYAVAGATFVGMLLNKDKKGIPGHPIVFAILLFWLWTMFTALVGWGGSPVSAELSTQAKVVHISKVLTFTFVSIAIMRSPNRLKAFFWVMLASLAFIGVKGGAFTLLTGGGYRVTGAGGMLSDRNQLAMAMAMAWPMAIYFYQNPPKKFIKWPAFVGMTMIPLAAVGTQSRGGLIALAAVTFMLILKTKHKFKVLIAVGIMGVAGFMFMPDSWKNRMATTDSAATEDESFRGRVSMWRFATNLVEDYPIEGGGFNINYVPRAAELYMPPGFRARASHSIYFEVLGEHGYVGLILFMNMLFVGWFSATTMVKRYGKYQETKWIGDMAAALQLSLVGYAVGGLTVNISTLDIFYHILATITMCHVVGQQVMAGKLTLISTGHVIDANEATDKWQPGGAAAKR